MLTVSVPRGCPVDLLAYCFDLPQSIGVASQPLLWLEGWLLIMIMIMIMFMIMIMIMIMRPAPQMAPEDTMQLVSIAVA